MSIYLTGKRLMDMTVAQVHELYKLRVNVFVYEQESPYSEIDDTDIHPGTQHLLAYDWYERFGFVVDGEEFEEAGRPHKHMSMRI